MFLSARMPVMTPCLMSGCIGTDAVMATSALSTPALAMGTSQTRPVSSSFAARMFSAPAGLIGLPPIAQIGEWPSDLDLTTTAHRSAGHLSSGEGALIAGAAVLVAAGLLRWAWGVRMRDQARVHFGQRFRDLEGRMYEARPFSAERRAFRAQLQQLVEEAKTARRRGVQGPNPGQI